MLAIMISMLLCSLGTIAFSCGDKNKYYIYYESELALDKEYDEFNKNIELYQPQILGYQFEGWWFDDDFSQKAPATISAQDITNKKYIRLYAKFTEKRISKIEILGNVKDNYEYGEKFDAQGAKVKVSYVNSDYEDEIFPITDKIVSNFYNVDENVSLYDLDKNDHSYTQNMEIGVDYCHESVQYVVYSDLRDVEFDGLVTIIHGDNKFDASTANVTAKWTNLIGEKGSTRVDLENSNISNYHNETLGMGSADLRFHFYTKQIQTEVVPNTIFGQGEVTSNIFLNDRTSLTNVLVQLNSGTKHAYLDVEFDDIVKDIDTSTAGDKIAKIKYGDRVIDISYYVIDMANAQSITLKNQLFVGDKPHYLSLDVLMHNGRTISLYIYDYEFKEIDTSSQGKKTIHVIYHGASFDVEYFVVDVNNIEEGEIKNPYTLKQLYYGMKVTFEVDDYTFTLEIYPADDIKVLTSVDTSSVGTKFALIELHGKQVPVKYSVIEG